MNRSPALPGVGGVEVPVVRDEYLADTARMGAFRT